jgi:hypothetical protein
MTARGPVMLRSSVRREAFIVDARRIVRQCSKEKEAGSSMKSRTPTCPNCQAKILEQLELLLGFHTELG